MAVFRIEKTRDYTVMSNHHLRNAGLSLKSKGLFSVGCGTAWGRIRNNTTCVRNIKKYLLAARYKALAAIGSYSKRMLHNKG